MLAWYLLCKPANEVRVESGLGQIAILFPLFKKDEKLLLVTLTKMQPYRHIDIKVGKWRRKSRHFKESVSHKSVVSLVKGKKPTLSKPIGTAMQPHNLLSSFVRERQDPGQWETTSKPELPGIHQDHHYQVGHLFLLVI